MSKDRKTVLAIFSHPDDELSVVGTLANHSEKGDRTVLVWLTKGEAASTLGDDKQVVIKKRRQHAQQVSDLLGCEHRFLDIPDAGVRPNQENAEKVARLICEIKPDIVVTWARYWRIGGGHPDHRYCFEIVMDAISLARYGNASFLDTEPHRKQISIYTYKDELHNFPLEYVDVTQQIDKIHKFIEIYNEAYGNWPVKQFAISNLQQNGIRSGAQYAECFSVIQKFQPPSRYLS